MTRGRLIRYVAIATGIVVIGTATSMIGQGTSDARTAHAISQSEAANPSSAQAGIRFEMLPYTGVLGSGQRAITSQEAVATGAAYAHADPKNGSVQVSAQYGSFSDDQLEAPHQGSASSLLFQQVAAWVVTFRGTGIRWPQGRSGTAPAPTVVEVSNVVINAETGAFMEAYSSQ